jgi:CarD family transcriptional regulator
MAQKKKTPAKNGSTKAANAKADIKKTLPKASAAKLSASAASSKPVSSSKSVSSKSTVKSDKSEVRVVSKAAPVKAAPAKASPAKQPAPHVAKPAAAKPIVAKAAAKPVEAVAAKPAAVAPGVLAGMIAARHNAAAAPRTIPAAVAKPAGQTISAPAAPVPVVASAPMADAGTRKPISTRHGFKTNEWIVYPSHGVGRIVAIEEQEIAGMALELFVITFEKDKMTLRVPTGKSQSVGMRKLADEGIVKRAMETLKGKARIKRTMWSRRAQEFEAKINSGDLVSIAEVVRDLFRADNQPEQSYSERQLYEAALDRMAREIAAVEKIDERGANQRITEILNKSAKGRRAAADEAAAAEIKAA